MIKMYSKHSDADNQFDKNMMAYIGGSKYSQ